jgi:hypothetical protein
MPNPCSNRASIYANRLFSRRRLDLRAHLVALDSTGERVIVHARTCDLSHSGVGLTLTCELPSGTEVVLYLRLPGKCSPLCLQAVIARRQGSRAGLHFLRPTAEQRLLLSEFCYA